MHGGSTRPAVWVFDYPGFVRTVLVDKIRARLAVRRRRGGSLMVLRAGEAGWRGTGGWWIRRRPNDAVAGQPQHVERVIPTSGQHPSRATSWLCRGGDRLAWW